jgi:hypothetical protein
VGEAVAVGCPEAVVSPRECEAAFRRHPSLHNARLWLDSLRLADQPDYPVVIALQQTWGVQ